MELFYPLTRVLGEEYVNLPVSEIKELNAQFNVNLFISEPSHDWFDSDDLPDHVRIAEESEIFNAENYGEL